MIEFFIRRPIVAICISIMIVMLGTISILRLPIAQYPDIVPPEIQISTSYPGADCNTVVDSVATPIEQVMSGVDGMEYMTSTSTNTGGMNLSVLFDVGTEPTTDQLLSYLRYAEANSQLPAEVNAMGITIRKVSGPPMLLYSLTSPTGKYDDLWMANYAYINLVNRLLRVPGVGNVQVFGAGQYAMRVWLDPDKLAALQITIPQVLSAIRAQNTVNPIGQIGGEPSVEGQKFTYTVIARGRLKTQEDFSRIIVRADGDAIVRLSDVGRVELGAETYNIKGQYNGKPCAALAIYQSPGSNALQTVEGVQKTLAEFKLAPGLELTEALNTTTAVKLGIQEIVTTLLSALGLVILVVFVFLKGWRATLIPLAAIPVSIVGTFALLPVFGLDINTICLMGLVLAIGLVVDDAIVVVEAVQTHIDKGEPPAQATRAAMKEVAGPVVATALVLSAVFLPSMLLPGITGLLFKQFAVTIGVSIVISAFNALSLSPALCALLLRPKQERRENILTKAGNAFEAGFTKVRAGYVRGSGFLIRKAAITGLALLLITVGIIPLGKAVPGGFLPDEDEGYFYGTVQLPYQTALGVTLDTCRQVEQLVSAMPEVAGITTVAGFNMMTGVQSANNCFFFVNLKPWAERQGPGQKAGELSAKLRMEMRTRIPGGIGFSMTPPPIPGVGASSDITFLLEDRENRGNAYLAKQTQAFIEELKKSPEILAVENFMAPSTPQYYLELDQEKALLQGVDIAEANQTLQAFMGSLFVNYYNNFGFQWQVYIQADADARKNIEGIKKLYLSGRNGVQVPLESLVTSKSIEGPQFMIRQNMYNASMLDIVARPGYSTQQVMNAVERIFDRTMPTGMGYSYSGMSYQEQKAAQGIGIGTIFAISAFFIYLVLASLYESWRMPIAILLSVPVAVVGALGALYIYGLDLNIYAEIGLIMLIALAAKNAILIVKFGIDRLEEGMDLKKAALMAAQVRFRPIIMTSFAFILGCVPLAMASGAGANAREVIGIAVIGGMLAAVFIGLFFLPYAFYIITRIKKSPLQEPQEAAASTPPGAAR
ncbi:efflux RND transporter permease subunit [Akkermansia glycaniphila]|uniref:efflux RND transporter permease subunit n=1 Tax=Akkermansia glycaniphila TaxID=1679444 RepID=UPI001C017735|nr:efflux RND transporter permease subunit [Akkermansia glycaniphila]MBT9449530.1 efflux RND transporter permease subunit [Akkermansia glycaniphila]